MVYIGYDNANLGLVSAWALMPLFFGGVFKLIQGNTKWSVFLLTSGAFSGIAYADVRIFVLAAVAFTLAIFWYRKWQILLVGIVGGMLFVPGLIYWARYILKGGMEIWGIPLYKIGSEGYRLAQFFSSWIYKEGHPGLGLSMMMALVILLWLVYTQGNLNIQKQYGFLVMIFVLFLVMTTVYFPWDILQRAGLPLLRLIGSFETPTICFGFIVLAGSVLGAYGIESLKTQENTFVRIGFPIIVIIAAVGICVYLCNDLTYSRHLMFCNITHKEPFILI